MAAASLCPGTLCGMREGQAKLLLSTTKEFSVVSEQTIYRTDSGMGWFQLLLSDWSATRQPLEIQKKKTRELQIFFSLGGGPCGTQWL